MDTAISVLEPDSQDGGRMAPLTVGAVYRRIADDAHLASLLSDLRSPKARDYLWALAHTGRKHKAIAVADTTWASLHNWREGDPAFAPAEDAILAHCKEARLHAYLDTLDSIGLEDRNLLAVFFALKQQDPSFRDNYKPDPVGHTPSHTDASVAPSIDAWRAMLGTLGLADASPAVDQIPSEASPALLPEATGDG